MSHSHQLPQKSTLSDNPAKLRNAVAYPLPEHSRQQSGKYHIGLDCYSSYQQKIEFKGYHSHTKKWAESCTVIQGGGGLLLLSTRRSASILSIQTPRTFWHVSMASRPRAPDWLSQDELSPRQDAISPLVITWSVNPLRFTSTRRCIRFPQGRKRAL